MSPSKTAFKCPVCGARFRGTATCSRCGGDLGPLMSVVARAWHARRLAASAIADGDYLSALSHVRRSRRLWDTELAKKTELIAKVLLAASRPSLFPETVLR